MQTLIVIAQRALSDIERFVYNPLFMLLGVLLVHLGVQTIRTKQVGARTVERLLYGKREYTGRTATFIGVSYLLGGLFLVFACLTMMILGRTLLPG